jgi:DNA-binding winged helix-turn-helix (wHTH) protein
MIVKFEDFTLDAERVELRKAGVPVTIEPQVFDLITYLATHSDHVVDRDELIANVWRGRIVSDAAISTRINAARRALEDDGRSQRVIKTVPRRGFRFIADVTADRPDAGHAEAPCFVIASPRATELLFDVGDANSAPHLHEDRDRIASHLEKGGGRIRLSVGNEVHAVFTDADKALAAARDAQQALAVDNARQPRARRAAWRIALGGTDAETHAVLQNTNPGDVVASRPTRAPINQWPMSSHHPKKRRSPATSIQRHTAVPSTSRCQPILRSSFCPSLTWEATTATIIWPMAFASMYRLR